MPWVFNVFTKKFDYFAYGDLDDLGDVTIVGVAPGDILRRGAADWNNYALGAAGQRLEAGALDPAWLWPDSLQNVGGNILTSTAAGIVALPRQSASLGQFTQPGGQLWVEPGGWRLLPCDTELYDQQGEFDSTWKAGTDDEAVGRVANHLYDSTNPFTAGDVGAEIWNLTDRTNARVTAYNTPGDLTLSANIMAFNEVYELYRSRITVTEDGIYLIVGGFELMAVADARAVALHCFINGAGASRMVYLHTGGWAVVGGTGILPWPLSAGDVVTVEVYQVDVVPRRMQATYTFFAVIKVI